MKYYVVMADKIIGPFIRKIDAERYSKRHCGHKPVYTETTVHQIFSSLPYVHRDDYLMQLEDVVKHRTYYKRKRTLIPIAPHYIVLQHITIGPFTNRQTAEIFCKEYCSEFTYHRVLEHAVIKASLPNRNRINPVDYLREYTVAENSDA